MRRLKKVMLVTSVLSGVGLAAAGTAQAKCAGDDPPPAAVDNAQSLKCDQDFSSSLITINAPVTVLGDSITNIGNFCTLAGPGK
ncbi:hypothetical protein [Streptomyces anandii]|uniref:hypothetical protein n=1 Tax=Streptomyces anandii TaxID=285454 RepID=UPI00167A045B|nr:hypothetical protein [Streptomyces anandii]